MGGGEGLIMGFGLGQRIFKRAWGEVTVLCRDSLGIGSAALLRRGENEMGLREPLEEKLSLGKKVIIAQEERDCPSGHSCGIALRDTLFR